MPHLFHVAQVSGAASRSLNSPQTANLSGAPSNHRTLSSLSIRISTSRLETYAAVDAKLYCPAHVRLAPVPAQLRARS